MPACAMPRHRCIVQAELFCTAHVSNGGFTTEGTESTEGDIINGTVVMTRGTVAMMNETLP
jgi:hypothetical protein